MLKRSACINMVHRSALAGMECGITEQLGMPAPEKYHDSLIYPALIQAGISNFKVSGAPNISIEELEGHLGLDGRIIAIVSQDIFERSRELTENLTKALLVESNEKIKIQIFTLGWFLTELAVALESHSAMVCVIPIPKAEDYYGILPLDIIVPIELLLKSINRLDTVSPILQDFIARERASDFLEILDSHDFEQYTASQAHLENDVVIRDSNVSKIIESTSRIKKRFERTLDIKKAIVSLLPVTAQIIDAVGGHLPGVIAGALSGSLEDYLRERKRIVMYDYRSTHQEILIKHYTALKRQRVSS